MKTRLMRGAISATLVVATFAVAGAGTAQAADGQDFGDHVSSCARAVGFNGVHNPGMHRGITGWDGTACDS